MDDTAAAEYLAKHGLADIIQKLTSEQPEDPYKFLVEKVSALSLENAETKTEAPAKPSAAPDAEGQPKEGGEGENQDKKSKKKKKKKEKGEKAKKKQGPNKGGGIEAKIRFAQSNR